MRKKLLESWKIIYKKPEQKLRPVMVIAVKFDVSPEDRRNRNRKRRKRKAEEKRFAKATWQIMERLYGSSSQSLCPAGDDRLHRPGHCPEPGGGLDAGVPDHPVDEACFPALHAGHPVGGLALCCSGHGGLCRGHQPGSVAEGEVPEAQRCGLSPFSKIRACRRSIPAEASGLSVSTCSFDMGEYPDSAAVRTVKQSQQQNYPADFAVSAGCCLINDKQKMIHLMEETYYGHILQP